MPEDSRLHDTVQFGPPVDQERLYRIVDAFDEVAIQANKTVPMMFIRTWTLLTVMLTALSLGAAIGHLLELPAKMSYDGPMWLKVQQTLYGPGFGTFGAGFEVGAVVSTAVLAVLMRNEPPAFGWVVLAALCMVATHAAFWILLAPANATIAALKPEAPPSGWMSLRNLWEYTHAARAALQIIALGALVYSILVVSTVGVARPDRPAVSLARQ